MSPSAKAALALGLRAIIKRDARLGEEAAAEESVTPARSKLVAEPSDEVVARCGMDNEGKWQHFDGYFGERPSSIPTDRAIPTGTHREFAKIQQPSTSSERVGQAEEFERQLARFPHLAQLREDIRRHYTARLDSMRSLGTIEEIVQLGAEYAEEMRALRTVSAVMLPEDFEDGAGSGTLSTTTPTTVNGESSPGEPIHQSRRPPNSIYMSPSGRTVILPGDLVGFDSTSSSEVNDDDFVR